MPPTPGRRPRWTLRAIVIAIGLIFIAIVLIVFGADSGHVQHALAVLGTVAAAFASVKQGHTAKAKSDHHDEESKKEEYDERLKKAHNVVADHFKTVSFWWYAFFFGAVAAVLAELIDWGMPVVTWLSKLL
jgi:hypothetical protein